MVYEIGIHLLNSDHYLEHNQMQTQKQKTDHPQQYMASDTELAPDPLPLGVASMTPPATPDKRTKTSKSQKVSVRRKIKNRDKSVTVEAVIKQSKQRREPHAATSLLGLRAKSHGCGHSIVELLHEPSVPQIDMKLALIQGSETDPSYSSKPWFVHPQYKSLSFSSSDDANQSSKNRSKVTRSDKSIKDLSTVARADIRNQNLPDRSSNTRLVVPKQASNSTGDEAGSEEMHENKLEQLLAGVPPAHTFHANTTNLNHCSAELGYNGEHPVLVDEFMAPEALLHTDAIETVNAAYDFLLGLQQEQIDLSHRSWYLAYKIRKKERKSMKYKKGTAPKIMILERARKLTESLCNELFMAEYAFRDLVCEKNMDEKFNLGEALLDLQVDVDRLVDKFDRRMLRLRLALRWV